MGKKISNLILGSRFPKTPARLIFWVRFISSFHSISILNVEYKRKAQNMIHRIESIERGPKILSVGNISVCYKCYIWI